ncbi:MAG TPA: deoxynucleoside kinase [Anaerolineales bacterium]|nr:deoxynucleoside kinase [Anaerolineales bacterium]
MTKHLLLVAGNIGAGKTSITERIGARLGFRTGYESVSDNPYLPDFYRDMRTWSFHLQIFFLGHRARQHLDLAADPQSAILDRSIYEDAMIFARALHHLGNLSERDYHAYIRVYELVIRSLPAPDLLIYLKAPAQTLLDRIRARGRQMEIGIPLDYLALLEQFYDEWIDSYDRSPVLTIRSDDLDFVNKEGHLEIVIRRIQDKLSGHEELVFD